MKKTLLFITGFVFSLISNAQLTNGQVYNFNVGDVFETESCSNSCISTPPNYVLTIVLKKWLSKTSDTLYYRDSVVSYTPPSCKTCTGSFSAGIDTLLVDSLSYLTTHFNFYLGNSCPTKDTLIDSGFCDRTIWEKYPDPKCKDSLFEPVVSSSWVIEGCGGGYFTSFDPISGISLNNDLIYYKKGPDSCGAKYVLTGINELGNKAVVMQVYPNPSKGVFTIESSVISGKSSVEVYNMLGEQVYSSGFLIPNSQFLIDLRGKPAGVYLYRVLSETGSLVSTGKLIIE